MISIRIHPHAVERMSERGATEREVLETIQNGEQFPAKFGRMGFRRNFLFEKVWQGRIYATKQVEVLAVREDDDWIVIAVVTRFF
jgi:hypothetical protein